MKSIELSLIAPQKRKQYMLEILDDLAEGQSLIISNNHDFSPLIIMLQESGANLLSFNYLTNGPEKWQVEVAKGFQRFDKPIGELIATDFRLLHFFNKLGIDICSNSDVDLEENCRNQNLDFKKLLPEIQALKKQVRGIHQDYINWSPGFLLSYLIHVHYPYFAKALTLLNSLSKKVINAHGDQHQALIQIGDELSVLTSGVSEQRQQFENQLYLLFNENDIPVSRSKDEDRSKRDQDPKLFLQAAGEEIGRIARSMSMIRLLSNGFLPPVDACATYQFYFKKLKEFETYFVEVFIIVRFILLKGSTN
jgi:regulator of cell morphogenesis and NO signaling